MKANKEIRIFLLISYGVPILLSIFMWIAHQNNLNCNAFPITWMFLPAAAVMVAKKCNETPDHIFPKTFYWTYIVTTFLMVVFSIASAVIDSSVWAIIINVLAIVCGVVCIIEMIAMGKEKRSMAGLSFGNDLKKTGFGILLFVILYAVIFALNTLLSACIRGMGWSEYVHSQINYFNPLGVILLIINLPLSYLAFFGEEYGWRYFFQPALQKKYGLRKGVILLGVLWGLWHIPLNFLYYSPKTGVFSFMIQVTLCVGIGVFMGWLYMKTGNIWSVVIVHYLQNNIGAIFFGASPVNVVLDFKDVLIALIVYMLVYLPFLNTKEYKLKSMSDSSEKLRLH